MAASDATAAWKEKIKIAMADVLAHPVFADIMDQPPLPIAVSVECDPRNVRAFDMILQCPWLVDSQCTNKAC